MVSIAAAVATALHHSAQRGGGVVRRPTGTEDSSNREEVEFVTHAAPRGQNTPPLGTRPGLPTEPEPQWVDAALSFQGCSGSFSGVLARPVGRRLPTVRFLAEEWKKKEAEDEDKRSLQPESAEPGCWDTRDRW